MPVYADNVIYLGQRWGRGVGWRDGWRLGLEIKVRHMGSQLYLSDTSSLG